MRSSNIELPQENEPVNMAKQRSKIYYISYISDNLTDTCSTLNSTVEIYSMASLQNWSQLYSITAPTWVETLTGTLGSGSLAV